MRHPLITAIGIAVKSHDDTACDECLERVRTNPLARAVKLADLRDNMDVLRLPGFTARDLERLEKYRRAWHRLTGQTITESSTEDGQIDLFLECQCWDAKRFSAA